MSLIDEEDVGKITGRAFEGREIRILEHEVQNKSECGGYMGDYLTLKIKACEKGRVFEKVFFIKSYKVRENGEDFIGENGYFRKEVIFYSEVLEGLKRAARGPLWCPQYFFTKSRVLVLEDLSAEGFRTASESTDLDKTHLKLALETLATMHASSLLLEQQKQRTLPSMYPEFFLELLYNENEPAAPARRWISWQVEDLLVAIELLDDFSEEEKKKIKGNFVDEIMRIYPLSQPSNKYRNVLAHGDMWRNNLLFKYSDGIPMDCRFVDFQFCRYAPPAHDVMHLIHFLTKKETRDKEETYYLSFYYDNLKKRLEENNKDVKEELGWEGFLQSCKEYKELALIQTLLSMHFILGTATLGFRTGSRDDHDKYLSDHRNEYMRTFLNKKAYADKVKDTLHELVDNYIIKVNSVRGQC